MSVTLSIRNVPDEIADILRARARHNHRSLQSELLAMLEEATGAGRMSASDLHRSVVGMGLRTRANSASIVRRDRDGR